MCEPISNGGQRCTGRPQKRPVFSPVADLEKATALARVNKSRYGTPNPFEGMSSNQRREEWESGAIQKRVAKLELPDNRNPLLKQSSWETIHEAPTKSSARSSKGEGQGNKFGGGSYSTSRASQEAWNELFVNAGERNRKAVREEVETYLDENDRKPRDYEMPPLTDEVQGRTKVNRLPVTQPGMLRMVDAHKKTPKVDTTVAPKNVVEAIAVIEELKTERKALVEQVVSGKGSREDFRALDAHDRKLQEARKALSAMDMN